MPFKKKKTTEPDETPQSSLLASSSLIPKGKKSIPRPEGGLNNDEIFLNEVLAEDPRYIPDLTLFDRTKVDPDAFILILGKRVRIINDYKFNFLEIR